VAEEAGRPVGFAELEPNGHIDRVYVSADHQRRGIGQQLLAAVMAEAQRAGIARLFTEASITARPFFEAQGLTSSTTRWSGNSPNQTLQQTGAQSKAARTRERGRSTACFGLIDRRIARRVELDQPEPMGVRLLGQKAHI
jgi:GNAT superfamily N-acetyltransferase